MKKLAGILLVCLAVMLSAGAFAQTDTTGQKAKLTPQQRAEKLTQGMSRQLLLSPEQVEQVKAINLKYAEKNEQLKRNMAKLKSNNEAKDAELKAVLNPAQYEKYQKMEKRAKQKVRERARERRAHRDTTLSTH